ncbi:unnamed protein product [Diatraea saccharalis]|uniref:WD repeat and HMG-box DNA-binding protein 1 n=1 Tax=Diatraea saccharalis TaxID=40085 RepID=A0A9N9RGG6_9NEOP|nr:unnamed protein product [Diatraea saccharalis]
MKIESKPLRYAHAEGHTDVCYSDDGQHLITCGNDGDVRIWVDIEDDDPNSHCVGESALAVCYKDKRLYVATDNHAVQAYTFPSFDKDGIVTRFTAPVTQIKSTNNIEALGCSSENMEARICSVEGGAPLFIIEGHKGPVLSTAICPHMKYATTASGDGILRIWDIDTQKIVKEITCVPKINTFYSAKVLCRMDFEPSQGKHLAYPNNREIVLLDCETWGQRMTFTHNSIKCAISQCLFSPCGQYLAGSTVAGQIAVWEVQTGNCFGIIEHPTSHNISSMAWNPKGNGVLAYCDVAGQLGSIINCYGKDSTLQNDIEMVERVDDDDLVDNLIQNNDSDDDDNAISLERIKNETLGNVDDDEYRAPSRLTAPVPVTTPPQPPFQPSATPAHLEHRYMCWNDIGIVRCHTLENGESSIDVEFHDTNVHHGINLNNYLNHTMASLSSTVLALACETPSKLVCISLVGSSKEWSVSMSDMEEILCIAAASGLVACATNARLLRLYTAMGTQRQVISLAGPVVSLAAYNTTVLAVYHSNEPGVTDQHLAMDIIALNELRHFYGAICSRHEILLRTGVGASGATYQVWSGLRRSTTPARKDKAEILSKLCQSTQCDILCVQETHRDGNQSRPYIHGLTLIAEIPESVNDRSQNLGHNKQCGRQVRSKTVPVPLGTGSKLAWIGTTDAGSPCTYDSTGILRLYDVASGVWMPICDTNTHSKGASDTWFIVSISEPSQTVRAILCRGTTFPVTVPKPIVAELPIQIPLCELDSEKSQYEEQLVRWAHTAADVDVKAARETALKLFALACRSEIEQRALELMELLKDERLLPLAAKYASRLGRMHLAEKLTDLADTWERDADTHNIAQNTHFQELDTQETYDVTNSEELNASIIIPQKSKEKKVENVIPIKPVPIKSSPGGKRNPFRMQHEAVKNVQSPLSLTERTLVEVHSNGDHAENEDPLKPHDGETFVDWFSRNKQILEQQNPEMTPSELTRQGVRMFKVVQSKGTDSNKRKLEDVNGPDTPVTSAPKQSKLSAFAFQKKS